MPYIFHCNAQFATGWQRRTVTSKNSSSFAFKTSRASLFLSQDEFVSIPSIASFRRMHFRRIDFYEWFSIYLRRSSTRRCTAQGSVLNRRSPLTSALGERRPMFVAHPPRLCHLHFASSRFRPNSFDVRRVKLLLQTQPDVYYGCLNGKFFCVPYSTIAIIGEKRVTPILIISRANFRPSRLCGNLYSTSYQRWSIVEERFVRALPEIDSIREGKKIDAAFL